MCDTIKEVYEQFKHLDEILSSEPEPDEVTGEPPTPWRQLTHDLWQAIRAAQTGAVVTDEIRETLAWFIADANFRREQTGLDSDPLSPEMQKAKELLADLETGKIEARRIA